MLLFFFPLAMLSNQCRSLIVEMDKLSNEVHQSRSTCSIYEVECSELRKARAEDHDIYLKLLSKIQQVVDTSNREKIDIESVKIIMIIILNLSTKNYKVYILKYYLGK